MERPATWKILTVGAALSGLGIAGAGVALADGGSPATDVRPIAVSAPAANAPQALAPAVNTGMGDLSPESADSPFESPVDSADSPFDSPDDRGGIDDTPDNTPDDSSFDDTPDD